MAPIKGITNGHRIEVTRVVPEDVVEINLREQDALELELTVPGGIRECVEHSEEAWTVLIDGDPEAYFGVTDQGVIWYLSSWKPFMVAVETFQILTDIFLDRWLHKYKNIWNTTLTENTVAIKWLKSKGFQTEDYGKWTMFWKEIES